MTTEQQKNQTVNLSQDELYRLAMVDELTGVYNRRAFHIHLEDLAANAASRQEQLAVLVLDIDKFKSINDTYGHPTGDKAIVALANILKDGVRDRDIVARYGGDEFIIILTNTHAELAQNIADRLRQKVETMCVTSEDGKTDIQCTISLGMVVYPDDEQDPRQLFTQADKALYASKRAGRNRLSRISDVSLLLDMEETLRERLAHPPFVAYGAHIDVLKNLLSECKDNKKHFAIIKAPSGFGKTTLLETFTDQLRCDASLFVCQMRCREEEKNAPYQVFVSFFNQILKRNFQSQLAAVELVEDAFRKLRDDERYVLHEFIMEFQQFEPQGSLQDIPTDQKRKLFLKALCQLMINLSQSRVIVIVMDNMHWADAGTLQVVNSLLSVKEAHPFFFVGSCLDTIPQRSASGFTLGNLIDMLAKKVVITQLVLSAFEKDAVMDLVCAVFDPCRDKESFVSNLLEHTQGNPRHMIDMIKQFKEKELIRVNDQRWDLRVDPSYFQRSYASLMEESIQDLDPEVLKILVDAAGIGQDFNIDTLDKLKIENRGFIQDALDKAQRARIIVSQDDEGTKFSFSSDEIKRFIWEQADKPYKRLLNRRLGEIVEGDHQGHLDDVSGELAYRYREAGMQEKAEEFTKRAAKRAEILLSHDDAVRFIENLLQSLEHDFEVPEETIQVQHFPLLIELLKAFKSVVRNILVYPDGHKMRIDSIVAAQTACRDVFEHYASVSFSVSRGRSGELGALLVNGQEMMERRKDVVPVGNFLLQILLDNKLDSITFYRDVSAKELDDFFQITSLGWEKIQAIGGMETVMRNNRIRNVKINKVRYRKVLTKEEEVERHKGILKDMVSSSSMVLDDFLCLEEQADGGSAHFEANPHILVDYVDKRPYEFFLALTENAALRLVETLHTRLQERSPQESRVNEYKLLTFICDIYTPQYARLEDLAKEALMPEQGYDDKGQPIHKDLKTFYQMIQNEKIQDVGRKQMILTQLSSLPTLLENDSLRQERLAGLVQKLRADVGSYQDQKVFLDAIFCFVQSVRKEFLRNDIPGDMMAILDRVVIDLTQVKESIRFSQNVKRTIQEMRNAIEDLDPTVRCYIERYFNHILFFLKKEPSVNRSRTLASVDGTTALSVQEESLAFRMLLSLSETILIDIIIQELRTTPSSLQHLRALVQRVFKKARVQEALSKRLMERISEAGYSSVVANFLLGPVEWKDLSFVQKVNDINTSEAIFCCFCGLEENFLPLLRDAIQREEWMTLTLLLHRYVRTFIEAHEDLKRYSAKYLSDIYQIIRDSKQTENLESFVKKMIEAYDTTQDVEIMTVYSDFLFQIYDTELIDGQFSRLREYVVALHQSEVKNPKLHPVIKALRQRIVDHAKFGQLTGILVGGAMDHTFYQVFEIFKFLGDEGLCVIFNLLINESLAEGSDYDQYKLFDNFAQVIQESVSHRALDQLKDMLFDHRWYVVSNVTRLMGTLKNSEFITSLLFPLQHDDVRVRQETLNALAAIGGVNSVSALELALDDSELSIQKGAVQGLAQIGTADVISVLERFQNREAIASDVRHAMAVVRNKHIL